MNWADWAIIAIVGISMFFSLLRGFVREAMSLVTWVAAFIIARLFSPSLVVLLQPYIETPSLQLGAAFALLFFATLIVGALITRLIGMLVSATGLSATDRVIGMAFGAVRGGILVVIILALVGTTPAINDPWWSQSQLIPTFLSMESWTKEMATDVGKMIWKAGQ